MIGKLPVCREASGLIEALIWSFAFVAIAPAGAAFKYDAAVKARSADCRTVAARAPLLLSEYMALRRKPRTIRPDNSQRSTRLAREARAKK